MKILVTGAAGFIGAALSQALLARGDEVTGVDNLNDYYDPALKEARLARLQPHARFRFVRGDFADRALMERVFAEGRFDRVAHLGAQAGVRYSLVNPHAYVQSNQVGFLHVLEGCRQHRVQHLVYASSSSVYGGNTRVPFSVRDAVDHPLSLYAATKKSNELMAHTYAHLYRIPMTGLRFFTVYGPWGRPDMAMFLFTRAILEGKPIDVFNHGRHERDFTYVDDIVEGVVRCLDRPAAPDPSFDPARPDAATSDAPWRLFNIGGARPVKLMDFIAAIERATGREAIKNFLPMQAGDLPVTCADAADLEQHTGFRPQVEIGEGVRRFVAWYRDHYEV